MLNAFDETGDADVALKLFEEPRVDDQNLLHKRAKDLDDR